MPVVAPPLPETTERGRNTTERGPLTSAADVMSGSHSNDRQSSTSRKRTSSRPRPQTEKSVANKAKDLSHVPCKFFKQGACSAGDDCPFSHDTSIPGTTKPVCQWFQKGSCRFGHKCALAHILPGQPMSMDRKNKRAAQAALREAHAVVAQETSAALTGQSLEDPPISGITKTLRSSDDAIVHPDRSANPAMPMSYAERAAMASPTRAHQILPGANSQLSPPSTFSSPSPSAGPLAGPSTVSPRSLSAGHVMLADQARRLSNNSDTRSVSAGFAPRAIPTNDPFAASPTMSANGNASPAIFGTSPFSGSRALFMPSSYDSNEDHFGRSPPAAGGSHLMARVNSGGWHARFREDDVISHPDEEEEDDSFDEAFLPSSLNDLLTPEEMQKRAARQMLSQSVPMNIFMNEASVRSSISPPAKSLLSGHPAHSSLHAQILARTMQSSSFDPGSQMAARYAYSDASTSPVAAPGSLPGGLAAGLSQLHLEPAKHTGETPPSTSNSASQVSTSPSAFRGSAAQSNAAWNGTPLSWGSASDSSQLGHNLNNNNNGHAQAGSKSPRVVSPSLLSAVAPGQAPRSSPQQQTAVPPWSNQPLGAQQQQQMPAPQSALSRRVSNQVGAGFHSTSSPLHHSVRSDEEEDDEEIQFEVEMS